MNVSKSYNSFLSVALEESMNQALHDIVNSGKIKNFDKMNRTQQVTVLLEQSPEKIIMPMKKYLTQCQKNNPVLDIKGIETEKNVEHEK